MIYSLISNIFFSMLPNTDKEWDMKAMSIFEQKKANFMREKK